MRYYGIRKAYPQTNWFYFLRCCGMDSKGGNRKLGGAWMGKIDQFDLFLPIPDEIDFVKADLKEAIELIHRVRKGQFAKIGELTKMYLDVKERLEVLERNICRGKDGI